MNKQSKYTFIASFIFALLVMFMLPVSAKAEEQTPVHEIRGTVSNFCPTLGKPVAATESLPVFTVEEGSPAYFSAAQGVWEKNRSLTKQWEEVTGGVFESRPWRFKVQVRIDNPNAQNWILEDPVHVYLNDKYMGTLMDVQQCADCSYGYIYTDVVELKRSVGILHYGYLSPAVSYHMMGETVYIDTPIPKGYAFNHWESSPKDIPFAIHSVKTSFVMPDEDVVLTPIMDWLLPIDEEHFPDKNFRDVLLKTDYGSDGIITTTEIETINSLFCPNASIHDLKGIENFTFLKTLYCQNNELETLDVSSLFMLKTLNCSDNHLACLDLTKNTNLKTLYISNSTREIKDNTPVSQLPGFDVSKVEAKRIGGDFVDGKVRFNNASDQFTYYYRCNNKNTMRVILKKIPEPVSGQWLMQDGKWWYRHDDGSYTRNDFEEINDKVYFFNESGYMITGWKNVNKKWYYLDSSGAMLTGWQKIDSDEYYFFNDGSMAINREIDGKVIGSSGAVLRDRWVYSSSAGTYWYQYADGTYPSSTFKEIDGQTYYFDESGYMLTGWQVIEGTWYYFNGSGAMVTGWQAINGSWYYFNESGAMVTGWQAINGSWYYFVGSGAMVTGWQVINGSWYYFVGSGAMVTGWQVINGNWYYFNSSGAMVTGWQAINGSWYYFNSSGAMVTGWQVINGYWYYFNRSGAMVTGWQWIGNYCYYFYSDGHMASNTTIGESYVDSSGAWVQ